MNKTGFNPVGMNGNPLNQQSTTQTQLAQSFVSVIGGTRRQGGLKRKKHGNAVNSMIGGINQTQIQSQEGKDLGAFCVVVHDTLDNIDKNGKCMESRNVESLKANGQLSFSDKAEGKVKDFQNKTNDVVAPMVANTNELYEIISSTIGREVTSVNSKGATFAEKQQFVKDNLVVAKEKIESNKEQAGRVETLQEEVTNHQNTINTLQKEKGELENFRREAETRLANVERNINTKQDEINRLTQENTDLEAAKNQAEAGLQTANETIRLATESLRQTAGLIAVMTGECLQNDAGLDNLIAFVDANISAASGQVDTYKQQKEKVEELEEELKKVNGEKEDLQNQLNDANSEKEQLDGRIQELSDQIALLTQQNEENNSEQNEFNENGNQFDLLSTELMQDNQINQRHDSSDHSNDGFEFQVPVSRQRSAKSLTAKEIAQAPENSTITLNRHAERDIGTAFEDLLNLPMDDRFDSCTQDKLVKFENAIVGNKNQSVTMNVGDVDKDRKFLVNVIQQLTDVLSGKQGNNTVITGFSAKMQKMTDAIASFKGNKAVYWMLLRFQLNCACEELNKKFTSIKAAKGEKGKNFQITMPKENGKDEESTIFNAFKTLKKLGHIVVQPKYSK